MGMGVGFLAEVIYAPIEDDRIGYALPEPESAGHGGGPVVEKEIVPKTQKGVRKGNKLFGGAVLKKSAPWLCVYSEPVSAVCRRW